MNWIIQIKKGQKPDVIVDFVFDRGLLYIELSNIGDAPARDIVVSFEPEIHRIEKAKPLSEMPLFRRLRFMPPQKKISAFLDDYASYLTGGQPPQVEVSVSFRDRKGKRYQAKTKHDLEAYREIAFVP